MAEKKNIEMYRGDSKTITVNLSANASVLANGSLWLTIKTEKDNVRCDAAENKCIFQTDATITEVLDTDLVTIIGYKGEIYIPPSASIDFGIESYYYDIQAVGADEEPGNPGNPAIVKTLIEGKFRVLEDVTIKTS